jgi:hypothetical protein
VKRRKRRKDRAADRTKKQRHKNRLRPKTLLQSISVCKHIDRPWHKLKWLNFRLSGLKAVNN